MRFLMPINHAYDPNGNRTSFTRTATQPVASAMSGTSYDYANEMLAYDGNNLTYDANGNLTSDGTKTYTWDARNRLVGINGPSLTASFSYDALGRRTSKTINGVTTEFIYDGQDIIQEIVNGAKTNYIRTLNVDEPLTRITPDGTVRHYVRDALGSTIALTDDTGAVKTTYTYDAFGNATATGETSDNPFQYTGRENDGTGLYYYRARYYSPEMRRFICPDPIRLRGGINFYLYTSDNPTNNVDSLGLDCKKSHDRSHCFKAYVACVTTAGIGGFSAFAVCFGGCVATIKVPFICDELCIPVEIAVTKKLEDLCLRGYLNCMANCR